MLFKILKLIAAPAKEGEVSVLTLSQIFAPLVNEIDLSVIIIILEKNESTKKLVCYVFK